MCEKGSRSEKSLSALTKKFVEMLKNSPKVDLKDATVELQCAKKRRIYDMTNVMEGVGLVRKVAKNNYVWNGKRNEFKNDGEKQLKLLQLEKTKLEELERELDQHILGIRRNISSLSVDSSYLYCTRHDFIQAFTKDRLILVGKDFHNMKALINESARNEIPLVRFSGRVVKPIDLRIVNTEKPGDSLPKCKLEISTSSNNKPDNQEECLFSKRMKLMRHANDLNLFRRAMKPKTFLDLSFDERERMASNVLDCDLGRDKSKFLHVNKNKLVLLGDYLNPDFIPVAHSPDIEYEDNFLPEAPSVHDLFDFDVEFFCEKIEDADDDEIIEEYIYEDEDYEMQ